MGIFSTLVGARVPHRYRRFFKLPERKPSFKAERTDGTTLARLAAAWRANNGCECGVYRLDLGSEALDIRLGLIDMAEVSIDIQSYLVKDDLSGNLIALALIEAASRGVRVRLLMDDALTQPVDPGLLALSHHVNIDVRVFNPFPRHRSRFVSFIANFNLLNRRMHNKSFTVDNAITIVGGRNLADEYYQTSAESEFLDDDLMAIGDVVHDVADGFDEYWNTLEATPIEELGEPQAMPSITEIVQAGKSYIEEHAGSPVLEQLGDELTTRLKNGTLEFFAARAELVLDHPDKVRGLVRRKVGETSEYLRRKASAAESELIVVSPYFVPLAQGVDLFSALVRKGVRVVVITNSLASTNHPSVHAVYARYRKPLLRQGIELYELRPGFERADPAQPSPEKFTLHSKLAIVDRKLAFVGSFNLDPRSLYINTEMGMAVESAALASGMAESIDASLGRNTYRLVLARTGGIRWLYDGYDGERPAKREPHTTLWRRISTRLMSLLPIESQM
ncbi:MAG: phospholipase D family protein [Woeseiaceae bacterium]|nr:phospholipase D family protein [Woeseiaceae bacterium]